MKQYIAYGYDDTDNAPILGTDESLPDLRKEVRGMGAWIYEYELVETEPKEELEHVQLEEKIGHTPPRYIPEVRKRPYTITFNITITPETTKKDIEKMVKLVEEFTEEKTKEE